MGIISKIAFTRHEYAAPRVNNIPNKCLHAFCSCNKALIRLLTSVELCEGRLDNVRDV